MDVVSNEGAPRSQDLFPISDEAKDAVLSRIHYDPAGVFEEERLRILNEDVHLHNLLATAQSNRSGIAAKLALGEGFLAVNMFIHDHAKRLGIVLPKTSKDEVDAFIESDQDKYRDVDQNVDIDREKQDLSEFDPVLASALYEMAKYHTGRKYFNFGAVTAFKIYRRREEAKALNRQLGMGSDTSLS